MGNVHLAVKPLGSATLLTISGKITTAALAGLRAEVERASTTPGGPMFLLDCADLGAIDSTTIGFLISVFKALRSRGRDLALIGLTPPALEALRITNLTRILPIHDNLDDALRALKG